MKKNFFKDRKDKYNSAIKKEKKHNSNNGINQISECEYNKINEELSPFAINNINYENEPFGVDRQDLDNLFISVEGLENENPETEYFEDKNGEEFDDLIEDDSFYNDNDEKCIMQPVQIFGTNGEDILPILTDSKGRLKISAEFFVKPIYYTEKVIKGIKTSDVFQYSPTFDISEKIKVSFIVLNKNKSYSATIQLQNSPDNQLYQIDVPELIVEPNSFVILTPTRFIRYQRIAYRSTTSCYPVVIDIFIQAQGNSNKIKKKFK